HETLAAALTARLSALLRQPLRVWLDKLERDDAPGSKVSPLLEFLPSNRTWQEFQSPLPHSWSGLGLIPLGARLYILGGRYQDKPADNNLAYQVIYTISIPVVR
ncbi:MAG TPA: hypothetical protein VF498_07030, partial [Anaerolineales bacterium]